MGGHPAPPHPFILQICVVEFLRACFLTFILGDLTLYNVCAVPWGVFSTVGDIMSTVGDILSTVGAFSTVGDIMINVGDILSTVGCSVPWGIS